MSEMIAFFVLSTKTTQPLAQVFLINVQYNLQLCCTFDVIGLIWPTKNGKIFRMNSDIILLCCIHFT